MWRVQYFSSKIKDLKNFDQLQTAVVPTSCSVSFELPMVAENRSGGFRKHWQQVWSKEISWVVKPVIGEDGALPLANRSTRVVAERYGGAGLGPNGGGVRCANIDGVQIKGIGANLLAGCTTDRWHRHGALSTQDAVRELIWGEILHHALPYGAARGLALASTGTRYAVEIGAGKAPGWAPRALLARECVLRPAHFMRSIFYEPSEAARHLASDTLRTREAWAAAHDCLLVALDAACWTRTRPMEPDLGDCWLEVWRRAAAQLAAARTKRFMHGSLTPSNFSVDGRWLDFGTTTALGDNGRALVAPGGVDMWRQEVPIHEAMNDLAFYAHKYLPAEQAQRARTSEWREAFDCHLRDRTLLEFARRSGVPEPILQRMDTPVRERFAEAAARVALEGAKKPYLYYGGGEHQMPARSGRHDLAGAMRWLAWLPAEQNVYPLGTLRTWIADEVLADELVQSLIALRQAALRLSCAPLATQAMAILAYQANLSLEGLWRLPFDLAVDSAARGDPERLGAFIEEFLASWLPRVAAVERSAVSLKGWLTRDAWLIDAELRISRAGEDVRDLTALVSALLLNGDDRKRAANHLKTGLQ